MDKCKSMGKVCVVALVGAVGIWMVPVAMSYGLAWFQEASWTDLAISFGGACIALLWCRK